MSEREPHNFKAPFDGRDLPINNLSPERMEEIETLMMPRLKDAFAKLRKEKPHLFKSEKWISVLAFITIRFRQAVYSGFMRLVFFNTPEPHTILLSKPCVKP